MNESKQIRQFYDFGVFRLDTQNQCLVRDGETISLTPKEFKVLLVLIENAGNAVTKNDLLDAVWMDTFVSEETLTRNVSWLRKKFGGEKLIETVPKLGYRLAAEVTASDAPDLIVEERIRTHIRIEETTQLGFGIADSEFEEERKPATETLKLNPKPETRSPKWLLLTFGAFLIAAIGFIVYQNYFRAVETKTILAKRIVPFSGATGRENTPSFSPDGKQIAFAWDGGESGDDLDIYVRLVGAIEPVRLTDGKFNEQYPTFSPDGSQIAFVRAFPDHGEVILIPALGGAERRVAKLFSGFASISFAPDGQTIAVIDTEDSTDGGQYAVYLINLQTGERRRVTAPAEFVGETTPRFAPDGKSLAFVRVFADNKQDLFVVPSAGGEPRRITFDEKTINSLAWRADGQKIFFVSYRGGGQANIWRVSTNGGEPELLATNGREITNLAVSPDNKTLAFVENSINRDIWRTAGGSLPARKLAASIYNEYDASFSPDGGRIVFTSNRTGKYAIWLADADGKNLRQLIDSPDNVESPRFSPDGSNIVYQGNDSGNSDIFIIPVEGGTWRSLTQDTGQNFAPTWSADGEWIYFISERTGDKNIWKIPANGGEAVQITHKGAFQAFAAPDGKTVFYTKQTDPVEMWRIPANGGAEQKLPEFVQAGFTGNWAMTKKGIYFLARNNSDQFHNIKFYDFANNKIKDIAGEYKIPTKVFSTFDATDNGVFLYSLLDQTANNIMIAELE